MKSIGRRLSEYLQTWKSFDWGKSNCCHLCGGWLETMGLGNPMVLFADTLTERSAYRIILEHGGFVSTVSHFLERDPVKVSLLKIGDLVFMPLEDERGTLGIVTGRHAVFCLPVGLVCVELTDEMVGWSVIK